MRSVLVFFTTALFLFGSVFAAEKAADSTASDEAVVVLTTSNFNKFIEDNALVLVEFYAPWCGHCQQLAPEYEAAAKALKESGGIPLAKVDATTEGDIASKYDVNGYPTLKLFRNGKPEEYKGGRTKDTILDWLQKMSGPSVIISESVEAALKEAQTVDTSFIGYFKRQESKPFQLYQTYADSHRSAGKFIAVINSANKDDVSVHRKGEGIAATVSVSTGEALETFCEMERFPLFGPINGENYGDYFSSPRTIVWFAGDETHYNKATQALREVAKAFREKHNIVWLNSVDFKDHANSALGVKEFPSLVLQGTDGRYIFPEHTFTDSAKVIAFFQDVAAGKIEKYLMSDPIPETNDAPVKVIVGKTFTEMVIQKDKDVLLEVYAPWCGHCKQFDPIYTSFAESMIDVKSLLVAKMDGTTNESPNPNFSWSGFPTIFFVKAGTDLPIKFDGNRTIEGLTEFIKQHSSKPLDQVAEGRDEL